MTCNANVGCNTRGVGSAVVVNKTWTLYAAVHDIWRESRWGATSPTAKNVANASEGIVSRSWKGVDISPGCRRTD